MSGQSAETGEVEAIHEQYQETCPDAPYYDPVPAPLTPVIDAHYPTTPVQCACGWRQTDPGAGSWVEHMVAAAQTVIAEPDNHHNAALCAYCKPRADVALPTAREGGEHCG